jgi:hypothetical protein
MANPDPVIFLKTRIVLSPVPPMTEAQENACLEAIKAAATEAIRKLEKRR